ncbi:TetR/AcrR family transcriptional regulator [Virgibacillus halodenitrificans]|uniref:TetR family transcriptional regulator n=1 Tax=Virgibacillus halodenitrificans TaxID=1482 RepID=A0AAC9NKH5_VIRHA|nr:TetR/AcrR family transcriptional regulator [Virgibacillus halodenitrificans]APC48517.1 TetR family transcriptional regulator [Virgibacillus halodenitrificans]MBD1224266.1 TetR/AcrR family transcriptional regulator [Virgibacillus halodenitrificans]MCJ0931092.1 TetR/AcrR family transcriptional regulator [Virgibacillus halodenitrificans]WHX28161.1 TetR/AcrR family transcriptional regulator [Virgibacillus halodenitrificans]
MRTELRQKIIQSALLLFEKQGYHGVTVNQIVEDVGTSKGGFYHHFKTKDELLYVIHDTFISYALEKATKANDMHDSPTKKLQAIIHDFVKVFDIYKPHISVFYQENIYLNEEYEILIKKKRDQFKNIIMKALYEGKEQGEFRSDLQVDITGMAILGMVNWTYKWYHQGGFRTIDDISNIFVDLILHAVLESETITSGKYKELLMK